MKTEPQTHTYPPTAPPPYPGPPSGANYPDPGGQSYPGYSDYPMTNQPQATVHPQSVPMIHSTTVIPAVLISNNMGPVPAPYVCQSCNQQIITRVERTPSMRTHLLALFLCILGCWPCVCVPYCVDSCNNAEHYCTNCNAYVGSYAL